MIKNIIIALLLVVCAVFLFVGYKGNNQAPVVAVNSYEECVAAGYAVMESYPPQCKTPDNKTFKQDIGNELEKIDKITVDNPRPNQIIASPLQIAGKARGGWYFEASFPAHLLDANGKELAVMPIMADGEWMTTDFVPFKATMTFATPETTTGTLILKKDNPSGLPENDEQLIIPVVFSQ